jgi:hypothetical protein
MAPVSAAAAGRALTGVPAEGTPVVLRTQRGGAYRSEVTHSQPGILYLQSPPELPAAAAPPVGTRLLVAWPDRNSLWVLPVVVLSVLESDGGLLTVQIEGTAWREERRRYPRTNLDATLALGYDRADGQPVEVSGELIDLSEAAMRCLVPQEHQALCQPRTPVRVRIGLAQDSFDISGYVLQGKPTARLDLGLEVVVLFHRPVPRVEDLRRLLGNPGDGQD